MNLAHESHHPEAVGNPGEHTERNLRALHRDLKTLAIFIDVYCEHRHVHAEKKRVALKTHDVEAIAGKPIVLCEACRKLLAHAFVKRSNCPMNPKPACKKCPNHCYHPSYRQRIREVMRFSGRRLVLSGRLDYLYHLLF
ncbi:MAG TPA: nitrous oxide-stimulated promoter family protein [Phycisphaerae bacterium]|nr:nitrous oxide-stimulated promoter family protein [Phycisphaerae bacterium]